MPPGLAATPKGVEHAGKDGEFENLFPGCYYPQWGSPQAGGRGRVAMKKFPRFLFPIYPTMQYAT